MKKILQKDSSVLRKISKDVPLKEIGGARIDKIIEEMKVALLLQDDGVAIAAPQIGYSLRIFIVSGKVKELLKKPKKEKVSVEEIIESNKKSGNPDLVFINPVIKKISKESSYVEEGCLSVRYLYGMVKRNKFATIEAYDEKGKKIVRGASGLLAQIFQHEIDHLDGILFTDKARDVRDLPPEKVEI